MRASRRFLCCALFLSLSSSLRAQDLEAAARDLTARILAVMSPREASRVTVENRSSLDGAQAAAAQKALQAELTRQGLKAASRGAELRVSLAENREGYLWVAEIVRGEERQVVMAAVPRPPAALRSPLARLTVERELLWEYDTPILDLAPLDERSFLVLGTQQVALVRGSSRDFWMLPALPWPRDPRGRLVLEGDRFRAFLPGAVCAGTLRPVPAGDCRPSADPWPLREGVQAHFAGGRNYFDGRLALGASGNKNLPPFYSAAAVPEGSGRLWIFAGLDGRSQFYDSAFEPAGLFGAAGSDLAALESACGSQVLVTKRSNETESDAVQAYEVTARRAVAQSEPLDFPGPLTALWTLPDGRAALAVARNLKTHRYAAFRLSIRCGR